MLFTVLLERFRGTRRYFSFGISNEEGGRRLNEGLVAQKTMFGARGIVYESYLRRF